MLSDYYRIRITYFPPRLYVGPDGQIMLIKHANDPPDIKIEDVAIARRKALSDEE